MPRMSTKTQCRICGAAATGAGISRHLGTHLTQLQTESAGKAVIPMFHLKISGGTAYFLHLLVPCDLTFQRLDSFLRKIWLECCGHMSQFMFDWQRNIALPKKIAAVLSVGESAKYAYDFGSTTELQIKVQARYSLALSDQQKNKIILLSRNEPYEFKCLSCGEPAVCICSQCVYETDNPFYCEACGEDEIKHACGEDYLLPICNSPRMGECAYSGDGDDDVFKVLTLI